MARLVFYLICLKLINLTIGQYEVKIFSQETKLGDVTHYDHGRWTGKNGLDSPLNIPHLKEVGTFAARWIHPEMRGGFFEKAPEDPHRKGYPDPTYFWSNQQHLGAHYMDNMKMNGNPEMVLETKAFYWPKWLPTSDHHGHFPNNMDAAAEFESLLIQAIDRGTIGQLPTFFEVVNEPDAHWSDTNWTTYVNFHKSVAEKLKPKFPYLKIGGPTLTGASANFDSHDFKRWNRSAEFLDVALANSLDFFSFHSYASLAAKGGTHEFHGNSEAKIFGLIDLVQGYSHKKNKKRFNIIISEYGLGPITGIDVNKPSTFLDWAYIYQHNAQLFTFLELRDVIRKVVAFLITHTDLKGQESINYSILDKNHNERDIAQAFKLWKPLHNIMTYLRVESQFHNSQRKIVPHALVDKTTGTLIVLLHNHDKKPTHVKLNFVKGWFHPTSGTSTCEYLNAQRKATLEVDKAVHVTNSVVTVPAEASCFFKFHTPHKFGTVPTLTQSTYYSRDMVLPIHGSPVEAHLNIPTLGHLVSARLRIGVSLKDKSANPRPKSVQINQHHLNAFYSLQSNNVADDTLWEMYEYNVPVNVIKQHNDVKMVFAQSGGYVSSVALVVGRQ